MGFSKNSDRVKRAEGALPAKKFVVKEKNFCGVEVLLWPVMERRVFCWPGFRGDVTDQESLGSGGEGRAST